MFTLASGSIAGLLKGLSLNGGCGFCVCEEGESFVTAVAQDSKSEFDSCSLQVSIRLFCSFFLETVR